MASPIGLSFRQMTSKQSLLPARSQTSKDSPIPLLEVGKLGKTIGLRGGLKFHLTTDFPECIQEGISLTLKYVSSGRNLPPYVLTQDVLTYTISNFNVSNSVVFFEQVKDIEQAKTLVNLIAYASIEDTRTICKLKQGEYFWFEIIDFSIIEENELLGKVSDIERIGMLDYLMIKTSTSLPYQNLPKIFMIPYIEHFILGTSSAQKAIYTQGAKAILEAS